MIDEIIQSEMKDFTESQSRVFQLVDMEEYYIIIVSRNDRKEAHTGYFCFIQKSTREMLFCSRLKLNDEYVFSDLSRNMTISGFRTVTQ